MEPSICVTSYVFTSKGLKLYIAFPHGISYSLQTFCSTPKSRALNLMTSSLRMWLNPHFLVKWCLFKCHLWVGKKTSSQRSVVSTGASDSSTMICGVQISKVTKMQWPLGRKKFWDCNGFPKKGPYLMMKQGGVWKYWKMFFRNIWCQLFYFCFFNLNFESFLFLKCNISKQHIYTLFFDSFQIQNLHVSIISSLLAGGFPRSNTEHRLWGWKAMDCGKNPWSFNSEWWTGGIGEWVVRRDAMNGATAIQVWEMWPTREQEQKCKKTWLKWIIRYIDIFSMWTHSIITWLESGCQRFDGCFSFLPSLCCAFSGVPSLEFMSFIIPKPST